MKKPSNLSQIRIVNSITQINKNEWDRLFPLVPENYNFFKTVEETLSEQFTPYYIAIYEKDDLVCLAPCFTIHYSLDTTVAGILKKFTHWLQKKMPKLFTIKAIVFGCSIAEGKIGLNDANHPEIIQVLVDTMFAIGREQKIHLIAFKDFSPKS